MKSKVTAVLVAAAVVSACETAADAPRGAVAVPLIGVSGQAIGTVRLWQTTGAVSLRVEGNGLTVGRKGNDILRRQYAANIVFVLLRLFSSSSMIIVL